MLAYYYYHYLISHWTPVVLLYQHFFSMLFSIINYWTWIHSLVYEKCVYIKSLVCWGVQICFVFDLGALQHSTERTLSAHEIDFLQVETGWSSACERKVLQQLVLCALWVDTKGGLQLVQVQFPVRTKRWAVVFGTAAHWKKSEPLSFPLYTKTETSYRHVGVLTLWTWLYS